MWRTPSAVWDCPNFELGGFDLGNGSQMAGSALIGIETLGIGENFFIFYEVPFASEFLVVC